LKDNGKDERFVKCSTEYIQLPSEPEGRPIDPLGTERKIKANMVERIASV
jgi:hypothetical protein